MDKPIRILHILQRMEAGGTQALLMNIYRNIDREKIQFDFLVEYEEKQFYDDEILSLGGKVYYTNLRKDYNFLKFGRKLKEIIKKNDYKIIHVHTYNIGYMALKIAKKYGVAVRIVHSHNNETIKDKKYFIKKVMQKVYTIHATDLFACSEEAGKYLFKDKRFYVLNNAIDTTKFLFNDETREKVRKDLGIKDELLIGNVGRLHAQKNHKKLIGIFKEIKNKRKKVKLLLVGNGPLEEEIKEQIENLDLKDDVIILKNRKDINCIYQAMDLFVFPSLFEGLGIVAIEAQVTGLPVICSQGVSKKVEITSLVKRISLDLSNEEWAEICLSHKKNDDRRDARCIN